MAEWEAIKIHEVVRDISDNNVVLPVIQRNLVWDEDKMELLFDSLLKGNSFGGIMALEEDKGSQPLFAFRQFSKEGEMHDSDLPAVLDDNKTLIIDGQQRLQAFYMGLKGGVNGKTLYFNLFSQVDYEFEFAGQVNDLPVMRREDQDEIPLLWYSVQTLYNQLARSGGDDFRIAKEIIAMRNVQNEPEKELILGNVKRFERAVFGFDTVGISKVHINKYDTEGECRRMVELFRRLNDGGTRLSAVDLAASTLKGFDYRLEPFLRRDIPGYQDIGFGQDEVIKLIFLLQDNAVKEVTDIVKEDADFAIEHTPRILKTLDVLRQVLKDLQLYEYYRDGGRSVIPLYFIAYHIFHKKVSTDALPGVYANWDANNPDFTNLKIWLNLSLLNGVFSRGRGWTPYRAGIRKLLGVVSQYKGGLFPTEAIFSMYEAYPLTFSREINASRLPHWDVNFAFYLLYYGNLSTHGRDIDHVQPKSLLEGANVPAQKIHWLGNYQLLDEFSNRVGKRAKELKEWIRDWEIAERQVYLERHLIPQNPDLWGLDHFEDFLQARSSIIVEKVNSLIPAMSTPSIPTSKGQEKPVGPAPTTKVEFDRASLMSALPAALQSHPILADVSTWADYFIKNNLGGHIWSRRISKELGNIGAYTVADLAVLIMTLGLRVNYTLYYGDNYEFARPLPSGQKPVMNTRSFGVWSWKMALQRLHQGGFDWEKYVVD